VSEVPRRTGDAEVTQPPRVGFVIEQVLGHVTYTMNLREAFASRSDIEPVWIEVPFHVDGDDRWPIVRSNWALRGSLAARRLIAGAHRARPLDALFIHTQSISLFAGAHMRRIPTLLSLDATPRNVDGLASVYEHRVHGRIVERAKSVLYRRVMRRAAAFTTWSAWAARSLVDDYGVPADRISVVYPGVSLAAATAPAAREGSRPRILFVGADLERKGGDLLIDVYRRSLAEECDLDVVTTAVIPDGGGVHVHRGVRPNSPELERLYASADIFVLPTRGDCLALVIGEAMAAGLPVVTTRGASHSDVVEDGRSGFLIDVDDGDALAARLGALVGDAALRRRMGARSRAIAEARLDLRHTADALETILARLAHGADGVTATRAAQDSPPVTGGARSDGTPADPTRAKVSVRP